MGFCCGASMIGSKGTLKHSGTEVHNVPLLFCPVCKRVEVHQEIVSEYEILAEYAHGDGAVDVDFSDVIDENRVEQLYENCVNHEKENPLDIAATQIDMALDLMMFARQLKDYEWESQLQHRLRVLSDQRIKLLRKKSKERA